MSISFLSIHELSRQIGVSPASISRFAKAMGFSGYPSLQKEIQHDIKEDILPMKGIKTSIGEALNDSDVLLKTIGQNIEGLKTLYNDKLADHFSKAIEIIRGAEKIYVMGMRSSYAMAYYAFFMLSQFMDNVVLLDSDGGRIFDRVFYSSSGDALIAVGFRRYTKLTVQIARHFHSQRSPIIAVTDSLASPLASYAQSSLIVPNNNSYSFSSAITVLNALIVGVGGREKETTLQKMERREELILRNDVYL
jgi:DNA-binding MurR/RpiR family transcriptional regulator